VFAAVVEAIEVQTYHERKHDGADRIGEPVSVKLALGETQGLPGPEQPEEPRLLRARQLRS
jgi:hypothetical protein